jgi:hypothetical protein
MQRTQDIKTLLEKWESAPGKVSIKDIQDKYIRENMAILMENQDQPSVAQQLFGEAAYSTGSVSSQTHAGLDGAFSPIALALVRRTFPDLFANKIVGVQAMSGPVGLAYALRAKYKGFNVEAGWDTLPTFSGFTGSFATSAGGQSGSADTGTGVNTSAAEPWEIGGAMPELTLVIDKIAISAKSRKLAASFSLESAMDIKQMHGVEVERELVTFLQYEVQAELDRELLAAVKTAATSAAAFDVSAAEPLAQSSTAKYNALANYIILQANKIGQLTRRGSGNFVIVSNRVASALQALNNNKFFTTQNTALKPNEIMAEVGTLNGNIVVYRDTYNTDDSVVVGYKGNGISDAGIIYSPYVTGVFNRAIDPTTFAPRVGVLSRYAITSNLLGAERYYIKFGVSNLASVIGG